VSGRKTTIPDGANAEFGHSERSGAVEEPRGASMVTERQEEPRKGSIDAALTAAVRCTVILRGVLEKSELERGRSRDRSYRTGLSTLRGPFRADSTPIGVDLEIVLKYFGHVGEL
jgi:hypothetical protein